MHATMPVALLLIAVLAIGGGTNAGESTGPSPTASAASGTGSASPDPAPAWPQVNGPSGNFLSRRSAAKLTDDPSRIAQLWLSEDRDLGFAKGSASGYVSHLADNTTHPGSASGLLLAQGLVLASSFRPAGDIRADGDGSRFPAIKGDGTYTGDRLEGLRANVRLLADDFTIAIDAATGKTVWKTVEALKGLNRYAGKRHQFHGTPAYADGRIATLGTAGLVYCYDAATGRKVWEDAGGTLVAAAAADRESLLSSRQSLAGGGGMGASLVIAEGVVVVPQYPGGADIALRGLDLATGQQRWVTGPVTSRYATPAVWSHGGRRYLVTATSKGELRLIDPRDGAVRWTVTGLQPVWYPLTTSADHVFVNVTAKENPKKPGTSWGRIGAYRITPERAEPAWQVPDESAFWFQNHMDICAMRRVLVRDGRVYYFTQGEQSVRGFSILDEATGKPLLTTAAISGSPQFFLVEDRLLVLPDAAHSDRTTLEFYTLDPADFRRIGEPWKPPHKNTTAYEVFIELPYADGRFYMRTWQGEVACYDLRAQPVK